MKCFEITEEFGVYAKIEKLTVNMKCFEMKIEHKRDIEADN